MRCHYEVLGVEREASATEIKTAYRRMALQWHPDKNIDDEQRAKEQFQLVQTAYEVLSDLHERAWYDKHREQLLRGAGSEFTDDSLDVFPFMSPSCYRGFTDDEKGFYAVYREVFSKLATEETDFLENPEDVSKIPDFGDSSSPYEVVNEFYNYWMSFTTSKTYVWLDQHDIRQSQHRKLVKVIERENAKVRTTARKERNTAVRTLASYARRRDPRVKRHLDELKTRAQQNRAKMEAARTERLAAHRTSLLAEAQAERSRRADEDVDYAKKLREVERQLQDEFGVSSDDQITTGDESGDDESDETAPPNPDDQNSPAQSLNRDQRLYCSACRKPFNTVPAFQNHEKSKKHRENVGKMTLNDSLPMSSEDTSLPSEATESAKKKKKKKKGKKKTETSSLLDVTSDLDQSNDDRSFAELQGGRKARKLDRKIRLIGARPGDRGSETENNERTTTESNVTQSDEQTNDVSVSKESVECESNGLPAVEATESPQDQPAKVKKAPPKKVQAELSCAVCKGQFSSKNKLFEHLKKSGHQVPIGTADIKIKRRAKR